MDYPCDECKELVPVEEHHGNERSDGTSSYLCCECYEEPQPKQLSKFTVKKGIFDHHDEDSKTTGRVFEVPTGRYYEPFKYWVEYKYEGYKSCRLIEQHPRNLKGMVRANGGVWVTR